MATSKNSARTSEPKKRNVNQSAAAQLAIAQELGVSQSTVSADLKAIQQEWLESASQDVEAARAKVLAELELIKREAWEAWRRSQQPAETAVGGGQSENRQMRRTRKHQHGDPRFLEIIHKSIAQKRALLGLDVSPVSDEEQPRAKRGKQHGGLR